MGAVFLVSLAGSEEERSRVDPVRGKLLSLYTVVVVRVSSRKRFLPAQLIVA